MEKPKVIAEIGCNHKGSMEIAYDMIKKAAIFCEVDAVKFQKRTPKEMLSEVEYNQPHPNPINSYGSTYGEHREFLEFDIDQHRQLQKWCEELGVEYGCSVWDVTSAKEIIQLNPKSIKIPSACNMQLDMLDVICKTFPGEIHISLGMTTHAEEDQLIDFLGKRDRLKDVIIYSCTSGYPVEFEDICLYEITRLKEKFADKVKKIGFSGHHFGIAADIGALTLGAQLVERHFTLNRTWKGTDHAASLELDGMRKLARDLRNVSIALSYKKEEILPVEQVQRGKLKRTVDGN